MTLDATLRPTAQRLIQQYGKTVTFSRASDDDDYDPDTGSSDVSSDDTDIKAVIDNYTTADIATGLVQRGDVKLTIADIDPPPSTSDAFTIDETTYSVVSVTPVYTGELIGIYEIQARRA